MKSGWIRVKDLIVAGKVDLLFLEHRALEVERGDRPTDGRQGRDHPSCKGSADYSTTGRGMGVYPAEEMARGLGEREGRPKT